MTVATWLFIIFDILPLFSYIGGGGEESGRMIHFYKLMTFGKKSIKLNNLAGEDNGQPIFREEPIHENKNK